MSIPEGTVKAAQLLLAAATRFHVEQVNSITLREVDAREDKPRLLTLIPLGPVIGVGVHPDGTLPQDADLVFVSAAALANCLPALGYSARSPAVAIVAPQPNEEAKP